MTRVPTGREPRELPHPFYHRRTQKKIAVCEPGRGSPLLDPGLPAPRTVGNTRVLCKPPQSIVFRYSDLN